MLTYIICLEKQLQASLLSSGNVEDAIGALVQNVQRTAGEVCLGSVPDVGYLHNTRPMTILPAAQPITTGRIPRTAARALILVMKAAQSDVVMIISAR